MNLHLATQFQILQYKMTRMTDLTNKEKGETNPQLFSGSSANKYYTVFKKYIQQHQALIAYCAKLESVFNLPVLAQVLAFSLVMCLDGYQILMVSVTHSHQLFVFTFPRLGECREPCMRKVQKCTEYVPYTRIYKNIPNNQTTALSITFDRWNNFLPKVP